MGEDAADRGKETRQECGCTLEKTHVGRMHGPWENHTVLTVDGEDDGGLSACVEVDVLGQASVSACLSPGDLGYHIFLARVDLRAVVKPEIVAGWVRRGQAGHDHLLLLVS